MSQLEVPESQDKYVLPLGKELKLSDVFHFCYGLTESDIQILMALLNSNHKTAQDLEQELQLSRALVGRSLNKLLSIGLVQRTKETGNKTGRPRYVYFIPDPGEFKAKLVKEIEDCTNSIRNIVLLQFSPSALISIVS